MRADVNLKVRPLPEGAVELVVEAKEEFFHFPLSEAAARRLAAMLLNAADTHPDPIVPRRR